MTVRNGNYEVSFSTADKSPGSLTSWCYVDSPVLSTSEKYVGPLSDEEIEWLKSIPGIEHSSDWIFKVINKG